MPSTRCSAFVIDNTTKRTRKCKLHRHFRGVCYIHVREIYRDSAVIIQKMWRGFQKRTKLKNLYYELPKELQMNVMRYVREDHYIEKKWIPSICRIYQNRIFNCHALKRDLIMLVQNHTITANEYHRGMHAVTRQLISTKAILDRLLD